MKLVQSPDIPVLLIDNVAEYFYVGSDQEFWDLRNDFPNLAPPFGIWWTEHKLPRVINSKEYGSTDVSDVIGSKARLGALWTASSDFTGENIPAGTKWVVTSEMFIDYDSYRKPMIEGPTGTVVLTIDAEGAVVAPPSMQCFSGDQYPEVLKDFVTWLHPSLLAVSFLHCRNVKMIDNECPAPLAKKYHAKTGVWPTKYHTLEIEPLKAILRHQGRSHEVGAAKAMHICRGHFKDYREGRGLFGKYHQIVWQPSVIRGSKGEKAPPREIKVILPK
jgi:hypothetical protein